MIDKQAAVGVLPDNQTETGSERPSNTRRPFLLCAQHLAERREWVNMPEGDSKREAHRRLFRAVAFCPECQELTWSGQAPTPPSDGDAQAPQQDTYSWWRDVMGQQ